MASSSGYSPVPAPRCDCECDCNKGAGGQNPNALGGVLDPAQRNPLAATPQLRQSGSGPFNMALKEGLEYSPDGYGAGGGAYGTDWVNPHQPRLVGQGSDKLLQSGATDTISFLKAGTGYVAEYFARDVLKYDGATKRYTVTSPRGDKQVFSKDGVLEAEQDAFGNEASYAYTGGELTSVQVGSGSAMVGYYYSFDTLGRLEMVIMRVGGTTEAFDYRRINYRYSTAGNLELVLLEEKQGGWEEIETSYYRYYPGGKNLLRFVLGDHGCEQMKSVNPDWPEQATDAQLAEYADAEYSYDAKGKVSRVRTHGGQYSYEVWSKKSAHSGSMANVWTSKTVIKQPDGATQTYYYNRSLSLLLLKVSEPQSGGGRKVWYPICQQFDGNARVVLSASSSSVDAVDESLPTLFTLKVGTGMHEVTKYDPHGNVVLRALRNGTAGNLIKQREYGYEPRALRGVTIYLTTSETVYREATGSGASQPATTAYSYTWHKKGQRETFQVKTVTTTLPPVPNAENGDNQPGTTVETYDKYGFLTKRVDEVGVVTTYQYYPDKGARKKTVQDAGTGRLNLTTEYEVDPLGRTTMVTGPEHTLSLNGVAKKVRRAQWTQYRDSDDETRTINGYLQVSDGSAHVINPVQISRHYANDPEVSGGRMEEEIAAVFGGSGLPPADQEFAQSSYVRWSTRHYSKQDEETHSRLYHQVPASGPGTSGPDYAETNYGYDSVGRQNKVTSPEGTIALTVFNAMSWPVRERTGTTASNLVTTRVNEYDDGAPGGDGNLTRQTLRIEQSTASDRVTLYRYDWRNRREESEANDGTRTLISVLSYDNRSNVTQADEYRTALAEANRISRAATAFDARNRTYQTKRFGVKSDGTLQAALIGQMYFDQMGRMVRDEPAGKVGFTVTHYDAVGRPAKQFRAYGGTLNLADPGSIASATVVEQTEFAYDKADNQLSVTSRQRFDNASGPGELKTPATEPKARVSYQASYPDALGRTVAEANYGTNGGAGWTRPSTVPARSDTVLVTTYGFNAAGDQVENTDPVGTKTKREYDKAGRQTKLIENHIPGGASDPDINRTTEFEYNLDGNLRKLTAQNATTGPQVTEWIYGVTVAQGSKIESKALLYQKVYPDSAGAGDRVTYTSNRQGQAVTMKDQASTQHGYSYDKFGRLTEDAVTAFGSGVNDTVRKIRRSYEARGMLEKVSSFGTGATPLNEVLLTYNDYSQLAKDYQAHSGAVSTGSTLHVGYSYANGSANTVRRIGITYPNGSAITMAYDGTAAGALSRPDALKEGGATLCTYRYLGSGVVVGVKYDAASNVELTYETGGSGTGDPYTGLDRFGRLVETLWKKGSVVQVRSKYGRNRFGGVVWRRDETAHAQSPAVTIEDNYYWYDGLYQVKERQQGNLTGTPAYTGIGNLQQEEDWTYDAIGNWRAYSNSAPANAQSRTHNVANEITQITASVGNVNPSYNPAGNMLTLPKAPGSATGQYTLQWDAWNRLVAVKDGTTLIASYTYDGLTRRLTKTNPSETRHYYYNDQWRALEERVNGATVTVDRQYTWGLRDRWDLLRRKRSTGGSSLNETLFTLRDYLDPVAIVGPDGLVTERYAYDAFGNVRILASDYTSRSNSTCDWNFLFHAEFLDQDSRLYNYGFRFYDTNLGRWLSRDPIGEFGGVNLYGFVVNDPILNVDRNGLEVVSNNGLPPSRPEIPPLDQTQIEPEDSGTEGEPYQGTESRGIEIQTGRFRNKWIAIYSCRLKKDIATGNNPICGYACFYQSCALGNCRGVDGYIRVFVDRKYPYKEDPQKPCSCDQSVLATVREIEFWKPHPVFPYPNQWTFYKRETTTRPYLAPGN